MEFQGGSFDPWGGLGFAQCTELLSPEFERVFYKNDFSFGMTIFNIYMTFGGTNWGNLGHPGGYTSYDYGAVIDELRGISREKYSEAKLEANFLQASPAFLTAVSQNNHHANASYTGNNDLATTALFGAVTKFFVIRHAAYNSLATTNYQFTFPTSKGNITVPQLGGSLSLHGRDSKWHVSDYDVGGLNLLYSTAEIFTWKKYGGQRVLVVYGGPGEEHELAVSNGGHAKTTTGSGIKTAIKNGATIINYKVGSRKVVTLNCGLIIYLLGRGEAYDFWTNLAGDPVGGNYSEASNAVYSPIVKAGYLLRSVTVADGCVHLTGDLNATASIEVIGGAPAKTRELTFNGQSLKFKQARNGVVTATAVFKAPSVSVPDLATVGWKVIDSLPEVQNSYDDSLWTAATLTYSNNTARNLTTPRSLYASDYGYHTGNLLFRGHFTATGSESTLYLVTQGGSAYAHSVWLNSTFVGSFYGADKYSLWNETYKLPAVAAEKSYVITVLLDNMGLDENGYAGSSNMKNPRGILDYTLAGRSKSDVSWKLTGEYWA